LNFKGYGE